MTSIYYALLLSFIVEGLGVKKVILCNKSVLVTFVETP